MAYDDIKSRGATKGSKPDAGGAVLRQVPVLGTVKNNIDPNRSGRIQVYIGDFGGLDPDDNSSWVTVSYMSSFYGMTECTAPSTGYGDFLRNPASYGVWNSPPDIGSTVICLFINGDPNFGFYIGGVPDAEALHMVPAIGGSEYIIPNQGEANSLGGATRLPATNINSNNQNLVGSSNFLNEPKPVHSYVASILSQQGLVRDPVRGVIGSSAQRESPSRVGWGVSTPGRPIYEGGFTDETIADAASRTATQPAALQIIGRRGGHTLVMDDGDLSGRDQLVRIRSALGHQILMSDDSQTLFIIHSNGQSWIELGKEGTIDMYATNSVNIRTQGDLNLHADNNININTKKNLNIAAENINIQSEKDLNQRAGQNLNIYAQAQYTVKVNGPMSMFSSGESSYGSSATTFINGSRVNLNTGSASLVPQPIKPIQLIAHTDALFDKTKGWLASPGSLLSIVSRAPTHQPYAMANKGVDVKVNNNASAALPGAPPAAVVQANNNANQAATTQNVPPVTAPVAATVPQTGAVSTAIGAGAAATMVSQAAVLAATGAAKDAVKQGAAVVETAAGSVAAIGKLGQTPLQLEQSGILKPGSAALINSLVATGVSIEVAITPNMFTGKDGINNLQDLIKNVNAQVNAQVTNFQQAQTQLTNAGILTGKESSTQIAGITMSTALVGLQSTVDFIKTTASTVTGAISKIVENPIAAATSLLGTAKTLIAGGNIAGDLANNLKGSIDKIGGTLTANAKAIGAGLTSLVDNVKGAAAGAYASIVQNIPTLEAGKPQNVKEIAEAATKKLQDVATSTVDTLKNAASGLTGPGNLLKNATGLVKTAVDTVGSALNPTKLLSGLVSTATSAINTATSAINTVKSAITTATSASDVATGLSNIPGGDNAVAAVVDNITNSVNQIPGVAQVKGLINEKITPNLAAIGTALPNNLGSGLINAATGLKDKLASQINDLSSGKATLADLAATGLPASAAASLNSAIGALSSAGTADIKMPVAALNTTDRTELTAQISSVLGSTKIPVPNFSGGISSSARAGISRLDDLLNQQRKLVVEKEAQGKVADAARKAFLEAKNNLPAGDPKIEELKVVYIAEVDKFTEITKKISAIADQA
jgi:hypothetical protein